MSRSKQLGALLSAVPPATARSAPPVEQPLPPEVKARPTPVARAQAPAPARAAPEVPLQVLVPEHIREQLGIMCAKERASLRSLILRAVRSLGIEVTDEEIKGKRGRRFS
jgi:hypothetical protein